jgi:hypothetical protein
VLLYRRRVVSFPPLGICLGEALTCTNRAVGWIGPKAGLDLTQIGESSDVQPVAWLSSVPVSSACGTRKRLLALTKILPRIEVLAFQKQAQASH